MTEKEFEKIFNIKEVEGRKTFYEFLKNKSDLHGKIKFKKIKDPIDAQLTAGTFTADVEIKVRSTMRFGDCILEQKKLNEMKAFDGNENKLYVAIYPTDNKLVIWNLNEIDLDEIGLKEETMNYSYVRNPLNLMKKKVYHLPFEKGKMFDI